MADQTEIGNGRRVAMAEPAGVAAAGELRLQGLEPLVDPVAQPLQAPGLVETELALEEIAHPRHDERMRVASDDHGKRANPCPAPRVGREQARLRMRFVEIFDDGQRLMKRRPAAVAESGTEHLRLGLALASPALASFKDIDLAPIGLDALEVEII